MPKKHRNFQPPVYGMNNLGDIFTPRQLVALATFGDVLEELRARVVADALAAGLRVDGQEPVAGTPSAREYADAVSVFLAFALSKLADYASTLCRWFRSGIPRVPRLRGRRCRCRGTIQS